MKRGRKNARCKAMERNTTTTTITTTTTRETRAHIPGNDNDDGTILTETLYFWIFLVASPPPFLIQIGCYLPISFSRLTSPSLPKPTTNYYDEDCTLSHRNTYLPTLRDSNISPPASATFSRFLPLSLFLSLFSAF